MKIAMFFSGRISLFLHHHKYIKELIAFIKKNDIKCFCALNDMFEISEQFLEDFNVVKYKTYSFEANEHLPEKYVNELWNKYIISTYYAHKLNIELIEEYQNQHNMTFDLIWYTRDDIVIDYILPKTIDNNTLYVTDKNSKKYPSISSDWAFGDYDTMKKY